MQDLNKKMIPQTRQRINPQFTLNVDIQEHNIIVFDDILTTGGNP